MKMRRTILVLFGLLSCFRGMPALAVKTTLYVGKHFEVRDHDQPTKYVFNGDTRIARITGSLSTNTRIQRFRLRPGWNLLSLAVSATNLSEQLQRPGVINSARAWNPQTGNYATVPQVAPAGTVLWVNTTTNTTLAVVGTYADPVRRQIAAGGTYLASTGLEAWTPTLPPSVAAWSFDSQPPGFNFQSTWHARLTGDLSSINDLPDTFPPGQALYVINHAPFELEIPDPALRIRYYHQDHLGSSSVMTDASGVLVEETAFYPFGIPRHEHRLRSVEEHYKFTQKERDRETGLHYFEARYLSGKLARFITQDPKYANPDALKQADAAKFLSSPQEMNMYAYARNNPLNYVDPMGLEVTVKTTDDRPGHKATEIKFTAVLLNNSSRKLSPEQLKSIQGRITSQLQGDYSGHGDQQSWKMTVNVRIGRSENDIKPTDHVIRLMDKLPPSDKTSPGAIVLGRAQLGGKWVHVDASLIDQRPRRANGQDSSLERVVSHEVGHNLRLLHTEDTENPVRHTMGPHNLMGEEDKSPHGTLINVHQIREIQKDYDADNLNK